MNELIQKLKSEFQDSEYRHAYCDEFLNAFIATQIKVLREQRGWTQTELGEHTGLHQSSISEMEDVSHSSWTIKSLRKLAEGFDLTLSVSFEEFGERIKDICSLERELLERSSFNEDQFFQKYPSTSFPGISSGNAVVTPYSANQTTSSVPPTPGILVPSK